MEEAASVAGARAAFSYHLGALLRRSQRTCPPEIALSSRVRGITDDRSTDPLEWLKEIKRRSRVVGTFPNSAAVIRLVGAILITMHAEWIADARRYLSEGSIAKLYETGHKGTVAAIEDCE